MFFSKGVKNGHHWSKMGKPEEMDKFIHWLAYQNLLRESKQITRNAIDILLEGS